MVRSVGQPAMVSLVVPVAMALLVLLVMLTVRVVVRDGEGAAGDITGGAVACDADGEGAVPGRWGYNVSGRDCWAPRLVVVMLRAL